MNLETNDRIEILQDAKDDLQNCVDKLREALNDTQESPAAFSYIIPHLEGWIDDIGFNDGIQQYIDRLSGYRNCSDCGKEFPADEMEEGLCYTCYDK